jgi:hypothetical protein
VITHLEEVLTYLEKVLRPMQPGIVAMLQPHFDALKLVIKQASDSTGADERGAEPESTHP